MDTDERGRSENADCKQSGTYDQNIDNYYPTLLAAGIVTSSAQTANIKPRWIRAEILGPCVLCAVVQLTDLFFSVEIVALAYNFPFT